MVRFYQRGRGGSCDGKPGRDRIRARDTGLEVMISKREKEEEEEGRRREEGGKEKEA